MSRPDRVPWIEEAACADIPKSHFFVDTGELYSMRVLNACASCPVWKPCLLEALEDTCTVNHGYRGGTTPRTRQAMRRDPHFYREFMVTRRNRRPA